MTVNGKSKLFLTVLSKRKKRRRAREEKSPSKAEKDPARVLATLCYRRLGSIRTELEGVQKQAKDARAEQKRLDAERKGKLKGLEKDVNAFGKEFREFRKAMRAEVGALRKAMKDEVSALRKILEDELVDLRNASESVRRLTEAVKAVEKTAPPPRKRARMVCDGVYDRLMWEF